MLVEVKARTTHAFGLPQEAVTYRKLRKLIELAHTFRQLHPGLGARSRIDVVAVDLDRSGAALRCEHIRDVLT